MPHHDDLLALARQMVDRNPGAQVEAELRRAVSTAYYALFHLLIDEATDRLVSVPALRQRVARTFDHNIMRRVCQEYADATDIGAGQYRTKTAGIVIPTALFNIASTFVALQEAGIQADYNLGASVTHAQAAADVGRVEAAFNDWLLVETHPATDEFLSELWCRGIPKRT
jgi:hypothetical protein